MASPIGISFIPTDENQAMGPQKNQLEGAAGSDLAQAFKVISLHLPRVLGARAISSPRLLNSQGSAGVPGAFNPAAAVFEALLQQMRGPGGPGGGGGSLDSLFGGGNTGGGGYSSPSSLAPSVVPGDQEERRPRDPGFSMPTPAAAPQAPQGRYTDPFAGDYLGGRHRA